MLAEQVSDRACTKVLDDYGYDKYIPLLFENQLVAQTICFLPSLLCYRLS